jgi:phosphoenolpyruvate carboxylase
VLHGLPRERTNMVVRAFSYFSHLANIAEDQHHIRRSRAHARAGAAPREGSLALSLTRAQQAGISAGQLAGFFAGAQVRPVLTAHPTEVQRKSILDCQWKIARLLDERDRTELSPEEQAEHDEALRRAVLRLWQTRMLRRAKLSVMDEVNNALSFYDMTFLRELPRLYNASEDHLARAVAGLARAGPGRVAGLPAPRLLDRRRPRRQPLRHRRGAGVGDARAKPQGHRLPAGQLHQLGAELSTTTSLIEVPDVELMRLAEISPDRSPHRLDEPYRRAIAGFYARLAATALVLDGLEAPRHAVGEAEPYATAAEFAADLDVLHRSLISHKCGLLGRGRLRRLRHAVAIFGFHLAPLDLRQNSDVHARTVAELLAVAKPGSDYLALDEDARIALLLEELATPRPLTAPGVDYSDETRGELAIFHAAREHPPALRPRGDRERASSPRPTASPTSSKSPCCSRKSACCGRWNTRWT